MRTGTRRMGIRLAALCAAVVSMGAGQAPPAKQQPEAAPPAQEKPVYRGGTTVIQVDVIVRDSGRRFVGDLRPGDFEVLDNGTSEEVVAAYRVVGPDESLAPGTAQAPEPSPLPLPPPQQVQRVLIFYFDQAHMDPGGVNRARDAAIDFMGHGFREGDIGGVVTGSTMVNNRLTSSRAEILAALRSVKPAPECGTFTRETREWPRFVDITEAWRVTRNEPGFNPGPTVLNDVVTRACREQSEACHGEGGGMLETEIQSKATQIVQQARLAGKQTLDTVDGLAKGLARIPGHKTIIMMTEGFFTEDTWADLRAVVDRASRASVRIYALDTRGLNRGSASSDIFTSLNPSQPEMSVMSLGDTNADGPNSLAVDTGGYVIRNENDFPKAFKEIDRDTSSYYIVVFRTTKPPDGKYHELKVKVKRPGVTVRARKGYMATVVPATPAEAPKPEQEAAAPSAPPAAAAPAPATAPSPAGSAARSAVKPGPEDVPVAYRMSPHVQEDVAALEHRAAAAQLTGELKKKAAEGWSAYQRGDVNAANTALADVAAHPEAPPWIHYVLGWTRYATDQTAAAAEAWEKVRQAVPEFEAVYFNLADAYRRQNDFGKSIDVLREAERRWPKNVDVYNALGVVQLARGAIDEAILTFTTAVGVDGKNADACYNLAKTSEVRYIRGQRAGKVAPGMTQTAKLLQDRERARFYYQRVVMLGGPLAEQAGEALKRLGGTGAASQSGKSDR